MSQVTFHVSSVTFQVSCVMCHVSGVCCNMFLFFLPKIFIQYVLDNELDLVGGGSVIDRAIPSSL